MTSVYAKVAQATESDESAMPIPLLYNFRRCPYAIRARLALIACGVRVRVRDIDLCNKPAELLRVNPKGTVPVLVSGTEALGDSLLICESLDIMCWALRHGENKAMAEQLGQQLQQGLKLIAANDDDFKPWLDKYKYFDRFPEQPREHYRHRACEFLTRLETRLAGSTFLLGETATLADLAILPFVRQFAAVEADWFAGAPYPALRRWLHNQLASPLFAVCMGNYSPCPDSDDTLLPHKPTSFVSGI